MCFWSFSLQTVEGWTEREDLLREPSPAVFWVCDLRSFFFFFPVEMGSCLEQSVVYIQTALSLCQPSKGKVLMSDTDFSPPFLQGG